MLHNIVWVILIVIYLNLISNTNMSKPKRAQMNPSGFTSICQGQSLKLDFLSKQIFHQQLLGKRHEIDRHTDIHLSITGSSFKWLKYKGTFRSSQAGLILHSVTFLKKKSIPLYIYNPSIYQEHSWVSGCLHILQCFRKLVKCSHSKACSNPQNTEKPNPGTGIKWSSHV